MSTFDRMWAELLDVGRDQRSGGYRRYAWTQEDATLREWFTGNAETRGLDVVTDRVGNQWAWWGDPDTTPGLVVGSHLDSVPDGGAYDGPLGVVSAFAALDALREQGQVPDRPIGVAHFIDEEGARFGVACGGSRLLTGGWAPEVALARTDGEGVSMAEAMTRAGHDPALVGRDEEALRRVGTFVELHVEQGRALADLERPVAVGDSIHPHGRWRLDLTGEANHAGTTRLADRRDAMLALAEAITTARRAAEERGCLATVGKVVVEPNGVNAIASAVTAWLDARGPVEADVRAVAARVAQAVASSHEESFTPQTRFDPTLAQRLAGVLDDAPLLATGAGHDAGVLALAGVPAAMVFVRNPTGVSHSPREHAEAADCQAGVDALARVMAALTGG